MGNAHSQTKVVGVGSADMVFVGSPTIILNMLTMATLLPIRAKSGYTTKTY